MTLRSKHAMGLQNHTVQCSLTNCKRSEVALHICTCVYHLEQRRMHTLLLCVLVVRQSASHPLHKCTQAYPRQTDTTHKRAYSLVTHSLA